MNTTSSFKIHNRIWISSKNKSFLGEGRIELLNEINKHRSISKAAKSMKMSYRKAWNMVDSMNKISKKPMVIRTIGGTGGGGSKLTTEGLKAIKLFNEIKICTNKYLESKIKTLDFS